MCARSACALVGTTVAEPGTQCPTLVSRRNAVFDMLSAARTCHVAIWFFHGVHGFFHGVHVKPGALPKKWKWPILGIKLNWQTELSGQTVWRAGGRTGQRNAKRRAIVCSTASVPGTLWTRFDARAAAKRALCCPCTRARKYNLQIAFKNESQFPISNSSDVRNPWLQA